MSETDIRVLVPRVRRALGGAPERTDDAIKDVVADAIADIMLYTGGVFGKTLIVTERDPDPDGPPSEYATSDELTFPEQSVVAAQAALTAFFTDLTAMKTSERIADEAGEWEYSLSASALRGRADQLMRLRDDALAQIGSDAGASLERYSSYLAIRDASVAILVEPWLTAGSASGQEIDPRFGV